MTDNTSREKLFVLADEAMYQYKQQNGEEARRRVWEYIGRQKMSLTSNC